MRLKSTYEKSYTVLKGSSDEYFACRTFRQNRKQQEYTHQPLTWEGSDDSSEQSSIHINTIKNDNTMFESPIQNTVENGDCKINVASSVCSDDFRDDCNSFVELEVYPNEIEKGSQTPYKQGMSNRKERRKKGPDNPNFFVAYGVGDRDNTDVGHKRTFNVKSDQDVYPSALRAKELRKDSEKLDGKMKKLSNLKSTKPPILARNSSLLSKSDVHPISKKSFYKTAPVDNLYRQNSNVESNRNNRKSTGTATSSDRITLTDFICPRTSSSTSAKINCERGNNATDISIEDEDDWRSEYSSKYPEYPTNVYTKSARSLAARTRSVGGIFQKQGTNNIPSLVQKSPVLLSNRGNLPPSTKLAKGNIHNGCNHHNCSAHSVQLHDNCHTYGHHCCSNLYEPDYGSVNAHNHMLCTH